MNEGSTVAIITFRRPLTRHRRIASVSGDTRWTKFTVFWKGVVYARSLSIIVSLWWLPFQYYLIIGTSSLISGKLVNRSSITLLFGYALSGDGWLVAMQRWF